MVTPEQIIEQDGPERLVVVRSAPVLASYLALGVPDLHDHPGYGVLPAIYTVYKHQGDAPDDFQMRLQDGRVATGFVIGNDLVNQHIELDRFNQLLVSGQTPNQAWTRLDDADWVNVWDDDAVPRNLPVVLSVMLGRLLTSVPAVAV